VARRSGWRCDWPAIILTPWALSLESPAWPRWCPGIGVAAKGTLRTAGLPSVVLARGLSSAAFIGSEAFLPLVLQRVTAQPALAGVPLTARRWAGARFVVAARYPDVSRSLVMRWGS